MYENLIREKIDSLNKESTISLERDLDFLHDLSFNLEQKRIVTKEKRQIFVSSSEELLTLNFDLTQFDTKTTKESMILKKNETDKSEETYKLFFVRLKDELSRKLHAMLSRIRRKV